MRGRWVGWAAGAIAAALVAMPCALAGNFGANPVRLTLSGKARNASLTLENHGEQPVQVQAEVMAWSQADGADVLAPTKDLLVSPPIFTMAAGATQTVRVGLLKPTDPERETTYRVFLQEVPPAATQAQTVAVVLRLGIPVFVAPAAAKPPALQWQLAPAGDKAVMLRASNPGNSHVQVTEVKLHGKDGTLLAEGQFALYVLPGQWRSWKIETKQPWRGERLDLHARTDGGDLSAEVGGEVR